VEKRDAADSRVSAVRRKSNTDFPLMCNIINTATEKRIKQEEDSI